MRRLARLLLVTLAGGFILAIVSGVAGEFFIELARERGWYDHPSQQLDAAMNAFSSFVTQTWFLVLTAILGGLAIGALLDLFLRRREVSTASPRKVDDCIATMSDSGHVRFDYSTNNGLIQVGTGDREFRLRFSKANDTSIYLYRDGTNLAGIARIKGARTGSAIDFTDYDTSSRSYTIQTGEHFIVANTKGYFLQGRVVQIQDDTRGSQRDEIRFDYEIGGIGQSAFRAL